MIKLIHRGISRIYPENTIGAIRTALQHNGYDGVETDLRLTKDNKWILIHDDKLSKITNQNVYINDRVIGDELLYVMNR